MIRTSMVCLALLSLANIAHAESPSAPHQKVISCHQATLARQGNGRSYSGVITNDDYAFSVRVPNGLTGWDGSAQDAPFHGFAIALDPAMTSCIVFEVHIRVDEEDAPKRLRYEKKFQFGEAQGWQAASEGLVGSVKMINVRTVFSFQRPGETDDGEIVLITPAASYKKAMATYDVFRNSLKFGH